jgi:AhpD family alkylhydroperoxidase
MVRVNPAPAEQVEPLFGPNAPLRLQIYAQRPPLAEAFVEFGATLRRERLLSGRLIELVRLRVAFWNQCRSCMAVRYEEGTKDGLTEALVCSLERPEDADDLTEAERAAIAFADLFATDHLGIGDETFARLREHFDEAEIVELCMNVALFVGFGRMGAVLHMVDDLPDRFRADGRVTPWGDGDVVRIADWATSGAA